MFFEQNVAAFWMAQLLVRGIPPILIDSVVAEVHFQTEHLGWHTDDFLVVCKRTGADDQKLVGQVKRTFTVSSSDKECKKAIQDFWGDFQNTGHFSQINDRLVLVTQRGTNVLLEHFAGLLDCARAARDAAQFEHRLAKKGFVSNKVVSYCDELCKIIADVEGRAVTSSDIWPFLRILYVLSLDLYTSTRQTEAQIKSLLAYTVTEGEPGSIASISWNALLAIASSAMAEARSFHRADLPAELQHRHGTLGSNEQRILRSLKEHTAPVLRKIRTTIGKDFHLQRAALVQKVLGELETTQVVLVAGVAGSGKSAIAKAAVSLLSPAHFVFGFRVEEFAQAHVDATLHSGQIPTNAETLAAILAAQDRKVVLIESVERLLEKTTRDAFSDLMAMAAADGSMRIILTCRDYSIEQVRASFLRPAAINHSVVRVPPLDDAELAEVEAALPELAYPLKSVALRDILRNPYFLDKALEITWSSERPAPESEREFRSLFWRQIVCAPQNAPSGMARRREETFQEIAVRRARALSAYVTCNDLDPAVVEALRQESLIVSSDENPASIATAHDVLEDWAILQWLGEQHLADEGRFRELSIAIGTHPAIRRSYRKWVAELVERDPGAADRIFRSAISETEISAQFRDDTLISLLKAPLAAQFLTRHEAQLRANDNSVLKRVIHLLRVACVTTPDWLAGIMGHGSVFNVPEGPAWATVLMLVHQNIDRFKPSEYLLLLGFIEDAARKVSWWAPEFDGAEFVAGIGHWLLMSFDNYRTKEARKRVLRVIAKIPKADPMRFETALRGVADDRGRLDPVAEDLQEIIYAELDGMPAARDLPDLVMSVAIGYLLATDDSLRAGRYSGGFRSEIETYFGINERLRHDFFPASALRGPWFYLLRYHPLKALDFFINVFNHSADWYAHPRVRDPLESAWEIKLTFADGATRKQWGNPRLWNLYRGTSVGPYVLQSMLMALEKWLLEVASEYPDKLDAVLVDILRRSENAALAAVVASVATANPLASGEALLVLLTAPDYIRFDCARMVSESHASALSGMLSQLRADTRVYEEERKVANRLPHRSRDLETAIINLQLGPFASRVHAILDRHLSELPPKAEQDRSALIWRLAIHRMDFRQYAVMDADEPDPVDAEASAGEPTKRYIRLEPKIPDPDVQAMVDESATELSAVNARLGILMWGIQVFERKSGNHDPSHWREKLAEARTMDRETDQEDGGRNGPGFIAAVCVRDHWEDMDVWERDWCVDVVCSELLRKSDQWNGNERSQRFSMVADRPSASVIPLLLGKQLAEAKMLCVHQAFAAALTHPVDEVRWYMTWGIDAQFWAIHHDMALRCVNAIATEATLLDQAWAAEDEKPYEQRRQYEAINAEAAETVRKRFWKEGGIPPDAHSAVNISEGYGAKAISRMLAIFSQAPNDTAAVATFARAGQTLVDWWDAEDDDSHRRQRDFDAESALSTLLQRFVMQTTAESARLVLRPILDAVDRHPREIHPIVEGLTAIEDSRPNTEHYWYLWGLFADCIRRAKWITWLDREHPTGGELLSAIFLTSWWKEDVRHWRSLEGYAHHVHALFDTLPPTSVVLDDYVRFLYHIGERSLPEAFGRVAESIRRGNSQAMLAKSNTVFLLEVLLQRHVYGRPLELKRDPVVRQAVLYLLDILVDNGSSAAFRMRDDFVTPVA